MRTIRFASTAPYYGNVASGSVQGYYTIWSAQVYEESGRWEISGTPRRIKVNQNMDDLRKYRGVLYSQSSLLYMGTLDVVSVRECSMCGVEMLSDYDACTSCQIYGGAE